MRYLKKLLIAVYVYLGIFTIIVYIGWLITKNEPSALIAGVFGAGGIESLVGGIIKYREIAAEKANKNNADPTPGGDNERGT